MSLIQVDFSKNLGPIKPMHGVNNGPLTKNLSRDARPQFKEAGIPFARLHDCEYPFGSGEYVNIPNIFKYFGADPEDPEAYNFALTDAYIAAIMDCGTQPLYRLGIDIEHQPVKRYIGPPADYLKWAKICEGIIKHYNEGWADGFHYGIKYWEIWCEPNHMKDRLLWGGTMQDFAALYTVTAKYLKERFPDIKIGGPAFSNATAAYTVDFFEAIKDEHPPMDFFSHHAYFHDLSDPLNRVAVARELLDKYGYHDAENLLDEWNYVNSWGDMGYNVSVINSEKGMAFNGAVMSALQDSDCDVACFYAAQMNFAGVWCSLFKVSNKPVANGGAAMVDSLKPFNAFTCFGELYRMGTQVEAKSDDAVLYATAAAGNGKAAIMLSSYVNPAENELEGRMVEFAIKNAPGKTAKVYRCDTTRDFSLLCTCAAESFSVEVPAYSLLYVVIE